MRERFGWAEAEITQGPRGALGQIWRVDTPARSYALKEIFAHWPSEAQIAGELAFTRRAAAAGVRLPESYPDSQGRYLIEAPDGTRLRLYEWLDLRSDGLIQPAELGVLLARLHLAGTAATVELDGSPPDPWYDRTASPHELAALISPADPARLVICHRDLHPENVLVGDSGELAVVDWDNLGPADPARELARALFDWYCDSTTTDLPAIQALYQSYADAGGPARIKGLDDFSMLIASRLNFLRKQQAIFADPDAEQRHKEWAGREIQETLHLMPSPDQLRVVLAAVSGSDPAA